MCLCYSKFTLQRASSRNLSILDSNHFYNNQEDDTKENSPTANLVIQSSNYFPDDIRTEEAAVSSIRDSVHSNEQEQEWQDASESDIQTVNEYPSLDSSEDNDDAHNQAEVPYIAQVPNKPAFVLKKTYQPALPAHCSLPQSSLFRDGLMFENQSYQGRKQRVTSLESPSDDNSDFSGTNENETDSIFEEEVEPYICNDNKLYFEVGL